MRDLGSAVVPARATDGPRGWPERFPLYFHEYIVGTTFDGRKLNDPIRKRYVKVETFRDALKDRLLDCYKEEIDWVLKQRWGRGREC